MRFARSEDRRTASAANGSEARTLQPHSSEFRKGGGQIFTLLRQNSTFVAEAATSAEQVAPSSAVTLATEDGKEKRNRVHQDIRFQSAETVIREDVLPIKRSATGAALKRPSEDFVEHRPFSNKRC